MTNILDEMNIENGSNYKKEVVKKHIDNKLFQRVVSMAYDRVKYTYGVTMKNVHAGSSENTQSLEWGLDQLIPLTKREITGNAAIAHVETILEEMSENDREIIIKVLGRDLKVNFGRTLFNKFLDKEFKIVKPPYSRCDIGTKKNVQKNIDFNQIVYSQVKMDGTYRSAQLEDDIIIMSRSGQEDSFPLIEAELNELKKVLPDVALTGEMTLEGEQQRSKGNGLINSDNPPHEDIVYTVWDAIPLEEYNQKNGTSLYVDRLSKLKAALASFNFKHVKLIEYKVIKSMREAYEHFQEITKAGGEGTVIKAHDMLWKDGTSKQQLKVKLEIAIDVIITGFTPGNGKNEAYFGAITFENHEGTIKGKVGVSSMTEKMRNEIHAHRDEYIGKIMEVHCNDITIARGSETHSLSHPRFAAIRDKNETDSLERALELKEMAMELK